MVINTSRLETRTNGALFAPFKNNAQNTWKCGELKLYFFPSSGGVKKKKRRKTQLYFKVKTPKQWGNQCAFQDRDINIYVNAKALTNKFMHMLGLSYGSGITYHERGASCAL